MAFPQQPALPEQAAATSSSADSQLFVVFLDDAPGNGGIEARAAALLQSLGLEQELAFVYDQLNGFALQLTAQQAQRLRALGGVKSVEADAAVALEPPMPGQSGEAAGAASGDSLEATALIAYADAAGSSGETVPWGVRAVWLGEDISSRGNIAANTVAFVIDSGVLNTTGDLNLAATSSWHRSWISGETAFTDGNGHGSHVAGTIAALANGKGVVGVAPGANVVSLKVFDSSGGGASYSTIIDAINHAVKVINDNGLDKSKVVINMSLGGGFSSSLDTAVKNAANQGIRLAIAAGNSGKDVDGYSPAAAGDHPNVFTISAVDSSYRMASFSNWDQLSSSDNIDDADFAAPGVSVLSYYRNGQLAYLSGTSMAAPHVAGLLLMGGIQPGDLVSPYVAGTADPFAWATGSQGGGDNPDDGSNDEPSYVLTSSEAVSEGEDLALDILTTNVAAGTPLYWQISGAGIGTDDFAGLSSLQGSVSTDGTGTAQVTLSLLADATTEGLETLTFELFSDAERSNRVGLVSAAVEDSSTDPSGSDPDQVLWGTTGRDTITGGSGNDSLSGVLASGATATAMGAGQIDVLTGAAGTDVFVLGDSRGVFYDDRNSRNLGSSDYALIKDFTAGTDKLQLRNGSYLFTVSSGNLSLYLDRNGNGSLNTSGNNRDELIAVLEGVSSLSGSDITFV